MQDLLYKIAFASIRGMGVELAQKLLDVVGSEKEFFTMPEQQLKQLTGGRSRIYKQDYRNQQLRKAENELKFLQNKNIKLLYYTDKDYPTRLLEACDAPLLLYASGSCNLNARHIISIVGTRHATNYGIAICRDIVRDLHDSIDDLVIVSGLAYGIDITAHRAALNTGTPTVAVMPRGLNRIYPADHRNDAINIVRDGGMVLTDYQSQDEIHKGNFLARNRIIAALSDCTLVVESAARGGALVTASLAQNYNRDVFAIPGRVSDEFSRGCNKLIHNNQALCINSASEITSAMRWDTKNTIAKQLEIFPQLNEDEQKIIDFLKNNSDSHINTISAQMGIPIYKVMSTLVDLDCKGLVIALPGSRYAPHL